MTTVWVIVSDGHLLDIPAVNVRSTEQKAKDLVHEMWRIWLQDNLDPIDVADDEAPDWQPSEAGETCCFNHPALENWEAEEWHSIYEVEMDQ